LRTSLLKISSIDKDEISIELTWSKSLLSYPSPGVELFRALALLALCSKILLVHVIDWLGGTQLSYPNNLWALAYMTRILFELDYLEFEQKKRLIL